MREFNTQQQHLNIQVEPGRARHNFIGYLQAKLFIKSNCKFMRKVIKKTLERNSHHNLCQCKVYEILKLLNL
ncbi:CLUMA_CG019951, isoform A [Clunio marinus]|uniref:CLUMA_CG019951, isoform A n=1 Tax=Clunio marinus TaxID=568069 RepID=A0A1J1J4Q1_9DIPT|nr:CLUMA_CG019951, isoform A [Clunio marinus]